MGLTFLAGDLGFMLYVKLILTAMFWGGTFVAGRSVSQHMGPFSIAFLRFAVASVLLLALTWRMEGKLPRIREWQTGLRVVLLGLTGILVYNVMFFKGLKIIEASRASLIIATCPAFITISSALFLKERIGGIRAVGIAISILGALIVISRGNVGEILGGGISRGELYILCCVLTWTAYSLVGKTVMKRLSPLAAVTYSSVVGAVGLAAPALREVLKAETWTPSVLDWVSIFYLAVCGTVIGFVWYYEGVRKIGPTKAGLFINFVPIFGVLFAFLLLHEAVTLSLLVGTVLVVGGVYLTNRSPSGSVKLEEAAEGTRSLERERETLAAMIGMYCRGHHRSSGQGLCGDCRELLEYAEHRLSKCPFGGEKGPCSQCRVHCYKPAMREQIRDVMRYAGPKMAWKHPLLAFDHLTKRWPADQTDPGGD